MTYKSIRPRLMIIGAAKAGTTAMQHHLARHPAVYFPPRRDTNFFSHPEEYRKGLRYYDSVFANAPRDSILAESSPTYARWPLFLGVPERIAEGCSDVRFIYMLREPVGRVWSHYRHLQRTFGYRGSLRDLLEEDPSIRMASDYSLQIGRYLEWFPKSRIHCVFQEEMSENVEGTLAEAIAFIGLDSADCGPLGRVVVNDGRGNDLRRRTTHRIRRMVPGADALAGIMPRSVREFAFDLAVKLVRPTPDTLRTTDDVVCLDELRTEFVTSNQSLESMLGRPLPASWTTRRVPLAAADGLKT